MTIFEYEEYLIDEERSSLKPEYRDSVTLKDALRGSFYEDFLAVKENIGKFDKQALSDLSNRFNKMSEEFSLPWYDEDLQIERSGYEWESNFYKTLADICKDAVTSC